MCPLSGSLVLLETGNFSSSFWPANVLLLPAALTILPFLIIIRWGFVVIVCFCFFLCFSGSVKNSWVRDSLSLCLSVCLSVCLWADSGWQEVTILAVTSSPLPSLPPPPPPLPRHVPIYLAPEKEKKQEKKAPQHTHTHTHTHTKKHHHHHPQPPPPPPTHTHKTRQHKSLLWVTRSNHKRGLLTL